MSKKWLSTVKGCSEFLRDRRGATAILFAVILLPLFAFAGFGIDIGIAYTLKRGFQSAVDNGAYSGAMETKRNRRRRAVSIGAIDRSAVFIVPITKRLPGTPNSWFE